jgi:hypothetical protein
VTEQYRKTTEGEKHARKTTGWRATGERATEENNRRENNI